MFNKYGEIAVKTVQKMKVDKTLDVSKCWTECATEIFGDSKSSIKKGCPKSCFLGLCEEGYVKGIPKAYYTKSKLNKEYGIKAVELIKKNNEFINHKISLWRNVVNSDKKHNSQMDVVIALFLNEYLNI